MVVGARIVGMNDIHSVQSEIHSLESDLRFLSMDIPPGPDGFPPRHMEKITDGLEKAARILKGLADCVAELERRVEQAERSRT